MLNEENKKREDKLQNSQESRAKEYNFYRQAQQDWQIVRILSSLVLSDLTLSSLSSHISIHICVTESTVWYYMLTVCGCGRANHKFDQCVLTCSFFFFELPPHSNIPTWWCKSATGSQNDLGKCDDCGLPSWVSHWSPSLRMDSLFQLWIWLMFYVLGERWILSHW